MHIPVSFYKIRMYKQTQEREYVYREIKGTLQEISRSFKLSHSTKSKCINIHRRKRECLQSNKRNSTIEFQEFQIALIGAEARKCIGRL